MSDSARIAKLEEWIELQRTDLTWLGTTIKHQKAEYQSLTARYDDAMKRIQDMQAELEFLRSELARRA